MVFLRSVQESNKASIIMIYSQLVTIAMKVLIK